MGPQAAGRSRPAQIAALTPGLAPAGRQPAARPGRQARASWSRAPGGRGPAATSRQQAARLACGM